MHQGRPYGLHVIGGKLTERDESFVSVTARRFSNLKDLSSIDSSRMVYDLPDGGYVVIQDMGGNFRIIAHKTSEVALIAIDGMATDYIPMLYSGVVLGATPYKDKGVALRLTEETRRRLIDYSGTDPLPPKEVALQRFEIEYENKFKYFQLGMMVGNRTVTQYHKLRATWYSGAMSEVVQIIGGYGRQDSDNLPDKDIERKRLKLPLSVSKQVRAYIANQRLPGYSGFPDFEGKYQYDYKHGWCNAVSFDSDRKPWLLQINFSGVYAMPLPMIPASTAPAFLSYLREVNDDELIKIVERFGGMPSGETFPTGKDFQAWYRAGVVIKVCEAQEFYKGSSFYEACGWSFNSDGSEGFNTCWRFAENGMRYAYGFKMRLRLGAAADNGWTFNAKHIEDLDDAALLNTYISKLFREVVGNGHRERAIRYKVMRTPTPVLMAHARAGSINVNYWENLIADPIAIHKGSISQVSSGPMYWPSLNPLSFGMLKFPEYTAQGCQSFDMTMPDYTGDPVQCDTVVFGCYVNDQLTTIKYFYDEREFKKEIESNFEEAMIIGTWEKTEIVGNTGLFGYLYTSAFDGRREIDDTTVFTKIEGKDLGYGSTTYYTPGLLMMNGSIRRSKYFSTKTQQTRTFGNSAGVAACVPVFARDCILYAQTESVAGTTYSESLIKTEVPDPMVYTMWTYDPIFHYIGSSGPGLPFPTIGQHVYANYPLNEPVINNEYSAWAYSGNWFGVPKGSFITISSTVSKYTIRNDEPKQAGGVVIGGAAPQLATYKIENSTGGSSKGSVSISITVKGAGEIHKRKPENFYYDFSPADGGGGELVYFYRDATWITFGQQRYASTSEKKDNGLRAYWGSSKLVDHKSAHCFIGVINE